MNINDMKHQILRFEKARSNLLAVIVFTVINIILLSFNAEISFLFSATLPQFIFAIGKNLDSELGSNIFMIVGLIIAFFIIITYFVFWILSKRIRIFILVSLIFFSIDSLVLLLLILNMEFNFSILFEVVFHGWILYYLIIGVNAWYNMRGINADEYNVVLKEIKSNNMGSTGLAVSTETNKDNTENDDLNEE